MSDAPVHRAGGTGATAEAPLRHYTTFTVAGLFCGIDVSQVQEVLKYQDMTPVPLAPETILGLINLRGQIVTAIDLRRRFRLPERDESERPMNIVLRSGGGAVSLLVDEIGDVLEVEGCEHEPPPSTMDALHREVVDAVFKLDGKLLLALNTDKVLNLEAEL
jgi:purine-binding chemotaxis protein CheW